MGKGCRNIALTTAFFFVEVTMLLQIIMLLARAEDEDRIMGLELGADDYRQVVSSAQSRC